MRIVVLTGAGISAESGLGTFRDKGGIWSRFDPMKLATPEAFAKDPEEVNAFYNFRRRNVLDAHPNPAHFALARLEAALDERGEQLTLVTQNIDDLHERAGARRAIHMHGELLKARCMRCEAVGPWRLHLALSARCPGCGQCGHMRPHVVWFGEIPLEMNAIQAALRSPACSSPSARQAPSTRLPDLWPRRTRTASRLARSIWSRPITPNCSARGDTGARARLCRFGWRR
jgi:NAD-dependent deacetylase